MGVEKKENENLINAHKSDQDEKENYIEEDFEEQMEEIEYS